MELKALKNENKSGVKPGPEKRTRRNIIRWFKYVWGLIINISRKNYLYISLANIDKKLINFNKIHYELKLYIMAINSNKFLKYQIIFFYLK